MTTQSNAIESLEPQSVWRFFAGIAAVPRPSKHEEQIRAHMRRVAEELGLKLREDAAGNQVIEAPASPGCENAPTIVLQGHLDMVPEKDADHPHDFEKDPIKLKIDKEAGGRAYVTAERTTLGADNGVGVALGLAAAVDPDLKHGPLELLNTVDEEAGMTGAKALEPGFLKGKILINLDTEEDDAICIGCAGGCDTTLTWRFKLEARESDCEAARISISGLRGGHSGCDIHENRGNANKVMARLLDRAPDGLRLAEINGGSARNVIPRASEALVCGPKGIVATMVAAAAEVRELVAAESGESDLKIKVENSTGCPDKIVSTADTRRLIDALVAAPHGVHGMHPKMDNLVQTSNNIGVVESQIDGDCLKATVSALTRSSTRSLTRQTRDQIEAVGRLAGAEVASGNEYPGWNPNPDSPTLAICRRIYKDLFGEEPDVGAIHAGLECGIINERMGGSLDALSFGPTITGAHSPDVLVHIDSVAKSWKFLKAVLAELAKS